MHELSIALSIVEMAEERAEWMEARVAAVRVRIGPLSGVVPEALASAFDMAIEGTALAGARLVIEESPVVILCARCGERRPLPSASDFRCPVCGAPASEVVGGAELLVTALEVNP